MENRENSGLTPGRNDDPDVKDDPVTQLPSSMSGVRERVRWTEIVWGMLFEPVGLALKFHAASTDVYDKHGRASGNKCNRCKFVAFCCIIIKNVRI